MAVHLAPRPSTAETKGSDRLTRHRKTNLTQCAVAQQREKRDFWACFSDVTTCFCYINFMFIFNMIFILFYCDVNKISYLACDDNEINLITCSSQ